MAQLQRDYHKELRAQEEIRLELKSPLWHIQISTFASRVMLLDCNGTLIADSLALADQQRSQIQHANGGNALPTDTLPLSPDPSSHSPEVQQVLHGANEGKDIRYAETNEETLFMAVPVLSKNPILLAPDFSDWSLPLKQEAERIVQAHRPGPSTSISTVLSTLEDSRHPGARDADC